MARSEGQIIQRSKGFGKKGQTFQIRCPGPHGKKVSETVQGTRKDAQKRLKELLVEVANGFHIDKSKETLRQYLEHWLEVKSREVAERTIFGYAEKLRSYVWDTLGPKPLQSLNMNDIEKLYHDLQSEPKNLSGTTVNSLHVILNQAFKRAVREGLLTRNPAEYVKAPTKSRPNNKIWELATALEFLEITKDTRYGDIYRLAIHTGMRRGELCGLQWSSIDWDKGYIQIEQTRQYFNGKHVIGPPKTYRSERPIAVPEATLDLLRSIKGKEILKREEAGDLWHETGYVFTSQDGSLPNPDEITRDFKDTVREHNLPLAEDMHLHKLRHQFASFALSSDISPKIVQETLGHSTIAITLDIYAHVMKPQQQEATKAVSNLLSGGK